MIHYIICKWQDRNVVTEDIYAQIGDLFSGVHCIEGVQKAEIIRCCIDRDNRYDLMIRVHMNKEALPAWDASLIHRTWKERFGSLIEKKTIFDEA